MELMRRKVLLFLEKLVDTFMSYRFVKTIADRVIALFLTILLFPLFLLFAVLIKLESRGPVFYKQKRIGLGEETFEIYKFRTMVVDDGRDQKQTLPGDDGITKVGKILRRLKIDEAAQLLNVLFGHMSFIGPRPCLPSLLEEMDDNSRRRFSVKPGLSGLAQVNGNIYIDWNKRWEFDLTYVDNMSLALDFKILLKTVVVILLGETIFAKDHKS